MPGTILNTGNAAVLKRDDLYSYGVYILVGVILYLILHIAFLFLTCTVNGFSCLNQTSRQEVDCSTSSCNHFSKATLEIEVYY